MSDRFSTSHVLRELAEILGPHIIDHFELNVERRIALDGHEARRIPDGTFKEFDSVEVQCPAGYLVDNDASEPAGTSAVTAFSSCECTEDGNLFDCALSPVRCSRRSCPDYTVIMSVYAMLALSVSTCRLFAGKKVAGLCMLLMSFTSGRYPPIAEHATTEGHLLGPAT